MTAPGSHTYSIQLSGCDDYTEIEFELTSPQFELLRQIAGCVNKVGGGCSPVLVVWPKGEQAPLPESFYEDGEA